MLKSLNLFFNKNTQKLLDSYHNKSDDKLKIIQRLWQLNAIDELLTIAQKDPEVKAEIIKDLLKHHKLLLEHFQQLLSWLEISKIQSEVIVYIKLHLDIKGIEQLLSNPKIEQNAKRMLENVLIQKKNISQEEINRFAPDEKYLKIKMIIDESEMSDEYDKISQTSTINHSETVVYDFIQQFEINHNNKIDFIVDFIHQHISFDQHNFDDLVSIINISNLNDQEKQQFLEKMNRSELYLPEFFICFTDFRYTSFSQLETILSLPIIKKWVDHFYNNHYFFDLYWLNRFYSGFDWVNEVLNDTFKNIVSDTNKLSERSLLSVKLNLTLFEIIKDKQILEHLKQSSLDLQNFINEGMKSDNFELEFYLKALIIIGGDDNFNYLSSLINRRPVEDMFIANQEIERKYLKLKKNQSDPQTIEDLLEKEQADKNRVLLAQYYGIVLQTWIMSVSRLKVINEDQRSYLSENIPDIKGFVSDANREGQYNVCKLIGLLKLEQQRVILESFVMSSDLVLQIHAVIALKDLGDDISKYIHQFAHSKNVLIRQEFARHLHLFMDDFDEVTLIKMALDNNALVCEYSLDFIATLNKERAIEIFLQIYNKVTLKNRYHLIRLLGNMKTAKVIPILVELLKNGDNKIYYEAINALKKINHPLSIIILKKLELEKNFTLELERAKSLIILGDFSGWNILKKYFNITHSSIQDTAKMIYVELSNNEQIATLNKLCYDSNPMISGYAIIKLYLLKENDALQIIDEVIENQLWDKIYYLSIFFSSLPFKSYKDKLEKLLQSTSLKCRTIATLIFATNNELQYIKQLEKEALQFDDSEHLDIVSAIFDYPEKNSYNLLKTICAFQNPNIIHKALSILPKYTYENTEDFVKELWNKNENHVKISIIDYIIENRIENLYQFIKSQTDYVPYEVQSHIFRAVIVIENSEKAWSQLDDLIRADEKEIKKTAIDALSKIEDLQTIIILSRYLSSPSEDIQIEVIKALGYTGNPEVIALINKYTESSSPRLKIALAKALGYLPFKDSIKYLEKLSIDRDEYVKVTADISLDKLQKGTENTYLPFHEIIDNLLKENTWLFDEDWFWREYNLFFTKYSKYKIRNIQSFKKKTVLDQDDYLKHIENLKRELERNLSGNTNLNEVLEAKKKHEEDINNLMIKEELIISLLTTKENELSEVDIQMIFSIIRSRDEILNKAIIFNACMSQSEKWLSFMDSIISYRENLIFSDFIIYALSRKFHFNYLKIIISLIQFDRCRYYLLNMINYYIIKKHLVNISEIPVILENLQKQKINQNIKENFSLMIKHLE